MKSSDEILLVLNKPIDAGGLAVEKIRNGLLGLAIGERYVFCAQFIPSKFNECRTLACRFQLRLARR